MQIIIGSIFLFNILFSQGFLHVENGNIVDGTGNPILLKGLGLGGWLVPEGYMLNIPGYGSPTEIENKIEALLGADLAVEFWTLYHENYVAQADIDQIAEWGFNSIRIPFHYKQFSPSPDEENQFGYDIVDSLLSWCAPYNMYIILDMHCAPGGQNHGEISDSDGTARLWLEDGYKEHTIEIWNDIATYYANETLIWGYDLINEQVLPDGISSEDLRDLYIDITNSIREVDTNHLLFIEGNWYGTDFTSLTPPWDSNMSYSFHKYWNDVTQGTIQYLINMGGAYAIPLWLCETGENYNHWGHEVIQLCESNNIGWNWWTHKKLEKITSPLSAIITPQYQDILDYWNGNGSQPSSLYAQAALFGMAENLKIEHCETRPGVIPALMDPTFGETPKPVKIHSIPGTIAAVDYDIGARNVAYTDVDYMNTGGGGYNWGWSYRNDGVDIEANGDENGLPYNVGWTDVGEWMGYTIEDVTAGTYDVTVSISAMSADGIFFLQLGEQNLGVLNAPSTGGWHNWQDMVIPNVAIGDEPQYLKLVTVQEGYNIEGFTFNSLNGPMISVDNISGWNLVGLPVSVEDGSQLSVFPTSEDGTLFTFSDTYMEADSFVLGEGCWLYFPESGTTTITGSPITSLTVSLTEGWNLISGISVVTNISSISDPGGIIVPGTCYGFNETYIDVSLLTPGNGYWIYASADGNITIANSGTAKTISAFTDRTEKTNKLSFNNTDLYFGVTISDEEMLSYQLPPKPPAGAFDARFKDGLKLVKDYGEIEVLNTTETLAITYEIMVDAGEHMNWILTSDSGKDYPMEGKGELVIPSEKLFILDKILRLPLSISLHQNFPNPFNPITTLTYDLPSDAYVSLTIFDMLGREITQLVNTTHYAGVKSVQWDGSDSMGKPVSAGVYIYQIQAGGFVQTKKMVLLK